VTEQNVFSRVFQVAAIVESASDGRMVRSGYVPYMANVGRRARRQGNPTTAKECEYETEPTEVPQYYEYGENAWKERTAPRTLPPPLFFPFSLFINIDRSTAEYLGSIRSSSSDSILIDT